MTHTELNHATVTSSDKTGRSINDIKGNIEPDSTNLQTDDDYLPMDIYVDPGTVKEHFQTHLQ